MCLRARLGHVTSGLSRRHDVASPATRAVVSGLFLMTSKPPSDTPAGQDDAGGAPQPPGMHRPHHSVLDTIETDALDEVQHENALRDSTLRTPR